MPYKDATAARIAARERKRRQRAREKAARGKAVVLAFPGPSPVDPVGDLAAWAAATLKVPPGHPLAGQAMALPGFAEDFLRAGWNSHESALVNGQEECEELRYVPSWRLGLPVSGRCALQGGGVPSHLSRRRRRASFAARWRRSLRRRVCLMIWRFGLARILEQYRARPAG